MRLARNDRLHEMSEFHSNIAQVCRHPPPCYTLPIRYMSTHQLAKWRNVLFHSFIPTGEQAQEL